jgi:hypothetical protein
VRVSASRMLMRIFGPERDEERRRLEKNARRGAS